MTYTPGQSLLHRLHPVVKLGWLIWGTVAVFVFDSAVLSLTIVGLALVLLWMSGAAPWRIPGMRLWLVLGAAIFMAHALAMPEGDGVAGGKPLFYGLVTRAGLISGLLVTGRLLAVILMSAVFVITTEPFSLARALMGVGLPYRWGFTLVTALRLAPIFRVEAHHVYRAQLVRGVAYDASGPRRYWLILRHLCLPLLVSAVRMAHWLSLSMEGRAFGLHSRRTYVREVPAGGGDVFAGMLLIGSILAAVWRYFALP